MSITFRNNPHAIDLATATQKYQTNATTCPFCDYQSTDEDEDTISPVPTYPAIGVVIWTCRKCRKQWRVTYTYASNDLPTYRDLKEFRKTIQDVQRYGANAIVLQEMRAKEADLQKKIFDLRDIIAWERVRDICPYCHTTLPPYAPYAWDTFDGTEYDVNGVCNHCHAEWHEVWKFSTFELVSTRVKTIPPYNT